MSDLHLSTETKRPFSFPRAENTPWLRQANQLISHYVCVCDESPTHTHIHTQISSMVVITFGPYKWAAGRIVILGTQTVTAFVCV